MKLLNRARRGIPGLIISWTDVDPMRESSDIIPGRISHRNPVYRLTAGEIFRSAAALIESAWPSLSYE